MRIFGEEHHAPKVSAAWHRTRAPRETFDRFAPVGRACGVTRLANVTGLDYVGVPVYVAVRPASRSVSVSQGKGCDADAAKVSALMEAIETWHAENITRPTRFASPREMMREADVVDVTRLAEACGRALDLDRPLHWIEGWDLLREKSAWVPLEVVSMDTTARPEVTGAFHQSTNGLASGNHLLEAVTHALYETIERDAITLDALDEREGTASAARIDLAHVHDPACRAVIDRIAASGLVVAAFDITSDIGIPTCSALLLDRPGAYRSMGYFWGFGTHLAPEVALSRALTEAAQCRLTEVSGAREDIAPEDFSRNRDDALLAALVAEIERTPATASLARWAPRVTSCVEGDLAVVLDGLRRADIQSAEAVDLTRAELGVPVVKVVVPALEPLFSTPGYQPGVRARRVGGGA